MSRARRPPKGEKGPDARRRPKAAREAFLYVERAGLTRASSRGHETAAQLEPRGANEADGPLSAAGGAGAGAAEARIEHVAEGVAEHVEAEDGEGDGGTGEDGHPRRALHEGAARAREHGAPGRAGRRDAEAEERERGLGEDDPAQPDGGHDDHGGEQVRHHVAQHDAQVRSTRALEAATRIDRERMRLRSPGPSTAMRERMITR